MIPDLQSTLVCEDVRLEANGFNTLVGVISLIVVPMVPFRIMKLFVFSRWVNGEGEFSQKIRILTPTDEREISSNVTPFRMTGSDAHTTTVVFFGSLEFPEYGDYPIEIYLNDDLKLRFPMRVIPIPGISQEPVT